MAGFALRRLLTLLSTLAFATVVVFLAMEVLPGDAAVFILGTGMTEETIAAVRTELGLDQPRLLRYLTWVGGMLQGDFGISYTYNVPVSGLIRERMAVSLPLALIALMLSTAIAIPVGVLAAARRNSITDAAVMGVTQIGIALPNFWFAILLVLLLSTTLQLFSAGGFPGWEAGFGPALKSLLLPAVSLALPQASILARVMRSSLIDALGEDYVRTARAKGVSRRRTLWVHAVRNALIPVLTIMGLQFSFLLAGTIIIENVFFLPGIGRLVFQAITQRDLIVVESVVVLLVAAVVTVNFVVDIVYTMVDPRLRTRDG